MMDRNRTRRHAGLPPQWDIQQAQGYAHEVEAILRGERFEGFLAHMYGNNPKRWDQTLEGWDRARFIVNCLTRLRYCTRKGKLEFNNKGAPGSQAELRAHSCAGPGPACLTNVTTARRPWS